MKIRREEYYNALEFINKLNGRCKHANNYIWKLKKQE